MTIYADLLILVNLYLDFFLLWCVCRFFHRPFMVRRLLGGALVGGVLSLVSLLPISSPVLSLCCTALTACLTTLAAFAPVSFRVYLQLTVCFFLCTLALAGFFLLLLQWYTPRNVAVLGSVLYFDLSPQLLFAFTAGAYLVLWLAKKLLPGRANALRCRHFQIENQGVQVTVFAKADTGCSLREPFSGDPVLLCEEAKLSVLPIVPEKVRVIPYHSVGGSGLLQAFRPERLTLAETGQSLSWYVAVSKAPLSAGQYDAIFNPDAIP